ncbi:MAG: hypothetical protein AAGE80_15105 [Pseudomonadota bacterium]
MADRLYTDRHPDIRDDVPMKHPNEPKAWIYRPKNITKIVYTLYGTCAALLLIDPFVHKHGYFEIEHLWGFYGIYGFIGSVFLVLAAKELRRFLQKPEDYYDDK